MAWRWPSVLAFMVSAAMAAASAAACSLPRVCVARVVDCGTREAHDGNESDRKDHRDGSAIVSRESRQARHKEFSIAGDQRPSGSRRMDKTLSTRDGRFSKDEKPPRDEANRAVGFLGALFGTGRCIDG